MLPSGPSKRKFAANAKPDGGRVHAGRDFVALRRPGDMLDAAFKETGTKSALQTCGEQPCRHL